jgi:hypothetical protein
MNSRLSTKKQANICTAMMESVPMLHLLHLSESLRSRDVNFWPHRTEIELKPTEMKHVAKIQETRVLKIFF